MFDSATLAEEKNSELTFGEICSVLDNLADFEEEYGYKFQRFFLTGGDPLLRIDWESIVAELHGRGKEVHVMGNPDTLTERNVEKLSRLGVKDFQLSLDGLRDKHDRIRGAGSFDLVHRQIALLRRSGLDVNVMFTLFPYNSQDLIPLLKHVATNTLATSFTFDIGCQAGSAIDNMPQDFEPGEIADLFAAYHENKRYLQRPDFRVSEKSNLHRLQKYARRQLYPVNPDSCTRLAGCLAGWTGLCLLSNGAALACRRLPVVVGKMPEQTFEKIFLGSEFLKKLRRHEFYEGCGQCAFYSICRGCPATTYGIKGNAFAMDPHCFRDRVRKTFNPLTEMRESLPLSSSYEQESAFIKENRTFLLKYGNYLLKRSFQDVFFPLLYKGEDAAEFIEEPHVYLQRRGISLNNDEIAWLMFYFSETRVQIRYNIDAIETNVRLRRHKSVQINLLLKQNRIYIELRGKIITASIDARNVLQNLSAHEEFTAEDVLKWDEGFNWHSVRSFLHSMLEELIICYAPR
jgi:radical SAM protein with 4Fe4S-binding SPASM domain